MGCQQSKPAEAVPQPHNPKHHLAEHMIAELHSDVRESYNVVRKVGEGSISNIYLVQKKKKQKKKEQAVEDKTLYALKEIDMDLVHDDSLDALQNEIAVMKRMDHPNIVKAFEVYDYEEDDDTHQHQKKMALILEYCSGGDLSTRVPYQEARAKHIVAKIVEAINYLHLHGIMHRDLKFENIMFESEAADAEPKLIDFGLARKYAKTEHFHDKVGTVYTMSPEAIRGDYNQQTDLWSVGVVTYMLLSGGTPPFAGATRKDIAIQVVKGKFAMDGPQWASVSKEAKNFIKQCLQIEPTLRYTADQALQSPWLKDITTQSAADLKEASTINLLQQMAQNKTITNGDNGGHTVENSEFRKLVLQTIAHKTSHEEILRLRHVFHSLDANHDGHLTLKELRVGLQKVDLGVGSDAAALEAWFHQADADGGGEVSYTEFLAALLETQGQLHADQVAAAFDALDRNHSGYITRDNLKEALGDSTNAYLEQVLQEADTDGDGQISLAEFEAAVLRHTSKTKSELKEQQQEATSSQELVAR